VYIVKQIFMMFAVVLASYGIHNFYNSLPIPTKVYEVDTIKEEAKLSLVVLRAPGDKIENLSNGVAIASRATGLSSTLIVSTMWSESNFKEKSISPKGYKGLMQTPSATFIYLDVDILHGARVLEEKLRIAKGDLNEAMMLYKGGRNSLAKKQAEETIRIYKYVSDKIRV